MDSKDFKRIEYKVKRSMSIQNLNFDNVLKIFLNKDENNQENINASKNCESSSKLPAIPESNISKMQESNLNNQKLRKSRYHSNATSFRGKSKINSIEK